MYSSFLFLPLQCFGQIQGLTHSSEEWWQNVFLILCSSHSSAVDKPRTSHILNKYCLPLSNISSNPFLIFTKHTKLRLSSVRQGYVKVWCLEPCKGFRQAWSLDSLMMPLTLASCHLWSREGDGINGQSQPDHPTGQRTELPTFQIVKS